MAHPDPALAIPERLVRHDERADGAHEGERRERRERECRRNEGEQDERADRAPPEDPSGRAEEERDLPEQVEGRAPQSATAGTVASASPGWPRVVLSPRAKRTTPATIGRWR